MGKNGRPLNHSKHLAAVAAKRSEKEEKTNKKGLQQQQGKISLVRAEHNKELKHTPRIVPPPEKALATTEKTAAAATIAVPDDQISGTTGTGSAEGGPQQRSPIGELQTSGEAVRCGQPPLSCG